MNAPAQAQDAVLAFLGREDSRNAAASIPMPRSCFSRKIGSSRSNARSACPSWTIRRWRNASRPVTKSLSSTSPSHRRSIAASSRSRGARKALKSTVTAPRSNGPSRWHGSTKTKHSIIWPARAKITPELAEELAAVHPRHAQCVRRFPTARPGLASVAGIIDRNTQTFRDEAALERDCRRTPSRAAAINGWPIADH